MADKAISELVSAEQITATDMFVLEQNGTAKKLTGQVLLNWLTAAADGHGGIQSIVKLSTSGLADTYRITLADTTPFDFVVTNGRGISSLKKTGTSGLTDTYTFTYNDGTTSELTVTNGQKGDKGDNAYIWVKYASQEPIASSNSFGDLPDDWMGVYFGTASTAPTNWQSYKWYRIRGEKGDTGEPAKRMSVEHAYQVGDTGNIIPSGTWLATIPNVPQGKFLWIRKTTTWNIGAPDVDYSVSRMGLDGSGSVSSVANISPDENGNVPLTAENIGALPSTGGDMTGELRMNGQTIRGLNAPTENDQAANMGFVNQQVRKAAPRNLLDNSNFEIAQAGYGGYHGTTPYIADRWMTEGTPSSCNRTDNKCEFGGESDLVVFQKTTKEIVDSLIGKTVTLAVKDGNGTIYCNSGVVNFDKAVAETECGAFSIRLHLYKSSHSYQICRITVNPNQIASICWVALYEGEYTLENLPEYQPKGYGTELTECMRYYQKFTEDWMAVITDGSGIALFDMLLPVPMRENPSANYTNNTEVDFDVFGSGVKSLLCEYIIPRTQTVFFAIKAPEYPNKWLSTRHTIELSADL